MGSSLVPEKLVEFLPGFGGTVGFGLFALELTGGHFKPFAEIGDMFFMNQFGSAFAALLGHLGIVVSAVLADAKVAAAATTGFTSAGLAIQSEHRSTFPAMTVHGVIMPPPVTQQKWEL